MKQTILELINDNTIFIGIEKYEFIERVNRKKEYQSATLNDIVDEFYSKKINTVTISQFVGQFIVHTETELKAVIHIYEPSYSINVIQEKNMAVLIGHEAVVIYFEDGTFKYIRTR